MPHLYEIGWVAHTAAWHRLADVKDVRPKTWDEAREHYLPWEPQREEVYVKRGDQIVRLEGWNAITRTDNGYPLTIQEESYAVIGNAEFGNLIEYIMGLDLPGMPGFEFEALSVLRKGRIIAVTLFLAEPFTVPGDNSVTYPFVNLWTRHDGQGGLKGGFGTHRVVCANTQMTAEAQMDRHGMAFTIRHTKNWADRMNEARRTIVGAVGSLESQIALAKEMAKAKLDTDEVEGFVERWLPISDKMTERQQMNQLKRRTAFWTAYHSETCETITGTLYGVSQAAIEACDHLFPARNEETRTARILLGDDQRKRKALALARRML